MTVPPSVTRLTLRYFGKPIIRNDLRGELVEEIVAMALEPDWELCGGDWAAFDLKQADGPLRIQVKQSAALQSWSTAGCPAPKPSFSICQKTCRWEGSVRIDEAGRHAEIYIFAWHDRTDIAADHRDPDQWQFLVVSEHELPTQKTIGLAPLRKLARPVRFDALACAVSVVATALKTR